jgi:hypothetical protein
MKSDPPMPSAERLIELKMTKEDVEAYEQERINELTLLLNKRSDISSMRTLAGGGHNAFMTDFLFFSPTLGPKEEQLRLIGSVEPDAAFVQISLWIGSFFDMYLKP